MLHQTFNSSKRSNNFFKINSRSSKYNASIYKRFRWKWRTTKLYNSRGGASIIGACFYTHVLPEKYRKKQPHEVDVYHVRYLNGEEGRETLMIDICSVLRKIYDSKSCMNTAQRINKRCYPLSCQRRVIEEKLSINYPYQNCIIALQLISLIFRLIYDYLV